MRILIHALGANMGGAMRHLTNFLPELGRQDTEREYTILVRESFPTLAVAPNISIERIPNGFVSNWMKRLAGDIFEIPWKLNKEKYDAIVSLTNFGPVFSPVPHIFFQRNALYYCDYYLSQITGREKTETLLRRRLAVESMKRADLIVTPTNAMAEMIKATCPEVKNRKFHTLYHGFSKDTYQEQLDAKYEKQLDIEGFKFLYPTHPAPHKGFEILFEILKTLKERNLNFKLFTTIAYKDWPEGIRQYKKQVQSLGIDDCVAFIGRIPQSQMGSLYKKCDLMLYPSLCESFGFSMIEAMGHDLPIVAAGTPVNREMCRDGAFYYPQLNPSAGAEAIINAIDPENRKKLVVNGHRRLISFQWGWNRYVDQFIKMIERVI